MRVQSLLAGAIALFSLTWSATAAPVSDGPQSRSLLRGRAGPPLPADDPFYKPPAGYESTAPGTVLRSRSIITAFFGDIPNPVQAWQLLYRTTATDGKAIATATTVFKPFNAKLDRFVSFATSYDSSATQCDPSYAYELGANSSLNAVTNEEYLIIESYLLQGYIVASPDYEGPDAAWTPGRLSGMGVLDNMRAVSNFGSTIGLSTKTPAIVGQGYSGGALATGWAAALQPSYAPELPIKGWAHGGTPANLTGVLINVDNTEYSGYLPAAIAGLEAPSAYGAQLKPVLDNILTAKGKAAIQYAQTHCSGDGLKNYKYLSIFSTDFQTLGSAVLQQPVLANILNQNILGATAADTPKAPVLVYHGRQDQIIPYQYTSSLVDRWCANGANVHFSSYIVGGHVPTAILGLPEVWKFVGDAFAGNVASGCSRSDKLIFFFNPVGIAAELVPLIAKLTALL